MPRFTREEAVRPCDKIAFLTRLSRRVVADQDRDCPEFKDPRMKSRNDPRVA
jgi:hypothetical protein